MDTNLDSNDIDIAILRSLLKAKQSNIIDQLNLALSWNRADIARDFIFTEDKTWEVYILGHSILIDHDLFALYSYFLFEKEWLVE